MKKPFLVLLLIFTLLFTSISYADKIETKYMDFMFDQIREADEGTKDLYIDLFDYFFGSDDNIDYLVLNFSESIPEEGLQKMKSLGVSESDVKENLLNLKTWEKEDRLKLIDLLIMDDQAYAKEQIQLLNDKYKVDEDNIDNDNGNAGTGSSPDEIEGTAEKDIQKSLKERLQARGLIIKPIDIVQPNTSFKDIKGHWSEEYVNYFAERNIINGRTTETFEPDGFIKENEIIKLLMEIIVDNSEKLDLSTVNLTENHQEKWYSEYLKQAQKLGIISDKELSVSIEPEAYPEREKIIHLIIRTLEVLEIPLEEDLKVYKGSFSDFDEVDEAFKESVIISNNLGLINGNANGTLTPKREITRGEISKILNGFYMLILNELN